MSERALVLVPLLLVGSGFVIGWWRLARRSHGSCSAWRVGAILGGIVSLMLAVLSPLDRLAHVLFTAHMGQHVLIMMVAPALLLLGNPFAMILWALPVTPRLRVARLLVAGARARGLWRALTGMPVAWLASAVTLWVWHLPPLYDAALRNDLIHHLEHLMLFGAGTLFWCPIIDPSPRLHGRRPYSRRIVYLFLAGVPQALLGLVLMVSTKAFYSSYAAAELPGGPSALAAQGEGGVIMWATSAFIGLVTSMVLVYRLLGAEECGPIRPSSQREPSRRLKAEQVDSFGSSLNR